jgi:hypothetical protein
MNKQMWLWIGMMIGGAALAMLGVCLGPGLGNLFPSTVSMMFVVGGVAMEIFPTMNIIGQVKKAKLFPFLAGTADNEQITLFADVRNRVSPIIVNNKHEGILHKRDMGIIEDKGTPLTWADTGIPISISLQKCGVTVSLKQALYQNKLEVTGLHDYEDALKRYLGPAKYTDFAKKFRGTTEPQYEEISKELDYLLAQEPNDPLSLKVCGETVTFKNFLNWLKYAYHPLSAENAVDSEILECKREAMAYKEAGKVQGWGKLILVILIGVGIFLVIISTMGPQLGKLFGGG